MFNMVIADLFGTHQVLLGACYSFCDATIYVRP